MSKIQLSQDGSAGRVLIPKRLSLVSGTTTPKADCLKGRFRLLDNALGADAGPWADTSGNAGSATFFRGETPTRVAAGLEGPASGNGFAIDSGVAILAYWTVVATFRTETDDYLPAQIQGWLAPSTNGWPALIDPGGSYGNAPAPIGAIKSTITGNEDDNSIAIWDKDSSYFSGDNYVYIPESIAPANQYNTVGLRFNAATAGGTGQMDLWSLANGYAYARTVALANYFGANHSSDTFIFGIWPSGLQRPADGTFCAIDIWAASTSIGFLDQDAMLYAMKSQAIDVAARGVTVIGYND